MISSQDNDLVFFAVQYSILSLLGFRSVKISPGSDFFEDIKYRPVWTLGQDKRTKTPVRLTMICPSTGSTKVVWPQDLNDYGVTLTDVIEYLNMIGAEKLPGIL